MTLDGKAVLTVVSGVEAPVGPGGRRERANSVSRCGTRGTAFRAYAVETRHAARPAASPPAVQAHAVETPRPGTLRTVHGERRLVAGHALVLNEHR